MRPLITLLVVTFGLNAFAQTQTKEYIEVSFSLPWKTVKIALTMGPTEIYSTSSDTSTILIYQDLESGYYKLSVTNADNNTEYRDSIFVRAGQKITANIVLDSACLYSYAKDYIPVCPAGHENGILEIRYRNEKDRTKGKKYHFVPYTATGCIERYYCTQHDIKF